jgi:nucleoside-diphosphate-sugar epimerase
MCNAILGAAGFLGSNLKWFADNYLDEEWVGITRENYELWRGYKFNTIIWAAGMSSKVKCQDDPDECFEANYSQLIRALHDFPAQKVIYISSFDIYPLKTIDKIESYKQWQSNLFPSSYYGATKFSGELAIQSRSIDFLILRCNGFTGPGLKKNAVYDIAETNKLWVSWDSRFQYIHVDIFARLLFTLATEYNTAIFNLTSPDTITPVKIAEMCHKDIKEIKQPADRVVPRVEAVMPVNKMLTALSKINMRVPSSEEAVKYWNVRYPFKVQMP